VVASTDAAIPLHSIESLMTPIVLITGRYQLGNDAGIFQDALYIGFELRLPFTRTWMDQAASDITFVFYTHDVETWGAWQGHRVAINNVEIGRLKDPDDVQGESEVFRLAIPRATLVRRWPARIPSFSRSNWMSSRLRLGWPMTSFCGASKRTVRSPHGWAGNSARRPDEASYSRALLNSFATLSSTNNDPSATPK
jgi:hypothetical protein